MCRKARRATIVGTSLLLFVALAFTLLQGGDSDVVGAWRTELRGRLPELIAKLRKQLAEGKVSEDAVKDVGYSLDPRAVEPLIEVLEAKSDISITGSGDAQYDYAAQYLGEIGDKRAIPALKEFLNRRLGSDTLPDSADIGKRSGYLGFAINWVRRHELFRTAVALSKLGELRTALPALRYIVQNDYQAGLTHLWEVALLPDDFWAYDQRPLIDIYRNDKEAMDTIYDYLRECIRSPSEIVRAAAALQLANFDRELAYGTAMQVLGTGIEKDAKPPPLTFCFWCAAKDLAFETLAAVGGKEVKEFLKRTARDGTPYMREAAQRTLERMKERGRR